MRFRTFLITLCFSAAAGVTSVAAGEGELVYQSVYSGNAYGGSYYINFSDDSDKERCG